MKKTQKLACFDQNKKKAEWVARSTQNVKKIFF
jgi:hypothetical protein